MAEKSKENYIAEGYDFHPELMIVPSEVIFEQFLAYGTQSDFQLPSGAVLNKSSVAGDHSDAIQRIQACLSLFYKKKGWQNKDDDYMVDMPFSAGFLGIGLVTIKSVVDASYTPETLPFTVNGRYSFSKAVECMVAVDSVYDIDHVVFNMLSMDRKSEEAAVVHKHMGTLAWFCYGLSAVRYRANGVEAAFKQMAESMDAMLLYGAVVGGVLQQRQCEAKQRNVLAHDKLKAILLMHPTGKVEHMHTDENKITYLVQFSDADSAEALYRELAQYGNVGVYMQPQKKLFKTVYVVTCEFYPVG